MRNQMDGLWQLWHQRIKQTHREIYDQDNHPNYRPIRVRVGVCKPDVSNGCYKQKMQ